MGPTRGGVPSVGGQESPMPTTARSVPSARRTYVCCLCFVEFVIC